MPREQENDYEQDSPISVNYPTNEETSYTGTDIMQYLAYQEQMQQKKNALKTEEKISATENEQGSSLASNGSLNIESKTTTDNITPPKLNAGLPETKTETVSANKEQLEEISTPNATPPLQGGKVSKKQELNDDENKPDDNIIYIIYVSNTEIVLNSKDQKVIESRVQEILDKNKINMRAMVLESPKALSSAEIAWLDKTDRLCYISDNETINSKELAYGGANPGIAYRMGFFNLSTFLSEPKPLGDELTRVSEQVGESGEFKASKFPELKQKYDKEQKEFPERPIEDGFSYIGWGIIHEGIGHPDAGQWHSSSAGDGAAEAERYKGKKYTKEDQNIMIGGDEANFVPFPREQNAELFLFLPEDLLIIQKEHQGVEPEDHFTSRLRNRGGGGSGISEKDSQN